jgi:hypothetical protein
MRFQKSSNDFRKIISPWLLENAAKDNYLMLPLMKFKKLIPRKF